MTKDEYVNLIYLNIGQKYRRSDLNIIFDIKEVFPSGIREFKNYIFLFVTLDKKNKSKDYQYSDFFNESIFHWESQNRQGINDPLLQKIIKREKIPILFIRINDSDLFTYFGALIYKSHNKETSNPVKFKFIIQNFNNDILPDRNIDNIEQIKNYDNNNKIVSTATEVNIDKQKSSSTNRFNKNLFNLIAECNYDLSIRTLNVFAYENILTIGDLVILSEKDLLRMPNFGNNSLDEVKLFLESYSLYLGMNLTDWPPENYDEKIKIRNLKYKFFFNPNIFTKLNDLEWTVRISNGFKQTNLIYIGDLVTMSERTLIKFGYFGRKSIDIIKEVLKQMSLTFNMDIPGWKPHNLDQIIENNLSLTNKYDEFKLTENSLDTIISELFNDRQKKIFYSRYVELKTLDEVGKEFNVTRERIRQIQRKIQVKLTHPIRINIFKNYLNNRKKFLLDEIFFSDNTFVSSISNNIIKKLDSLDKISIQILYKSNTLVNSIELLLDHIAFKYPNHHPPVWLINEVKDTSIINQMISSVISRAEVSYFPIFQETFTESLNLEFNDFIYREAGLEMYRGFLLKPGYKFENYHFRQKSAVDLYIFIHQNFGVRYLNKIDFLEKSLGDLVSDRDYSYRYLFMHIADKCPHLFIKTPNPNYGLSILPIKNFSHHIKISKENIKFEELDDRVKNSNSMQKSQQLISNLLEKNGSMPFKVLNQKYAETLKILPAQASRNLLFVLTQTDIFHFLTPSYCCKTDQLSDPINPIYYNEELVNEYIQYAHTYKTINLYSAFDISFEKNICQWAKENLNNEKFQTLLSVCNINDWNMNEFDKVKWTEIKQDNFVPLKLAINPIDILNNLPNIYVLLSLLILIKTHTFIAYAILISFPKKSKSLSSTKGLSSHSLDVNILITLSLIGVVEAPDDYLLPHYSTSKLDDIIGLLSDELISEGDLQWEGKAGIAIKEIIQNGLRSSQLKSDWFAKDYFVIFK